METTDIVIHKGEKDDKYQLYVEDYVMSYLKNYGAADGRKIYFYGTREQKNNKYYIYGAGREKQISYFIRYELLDEIRCRFEMDKPVFSVKEEAGRYEISGYHIFYQSNEAMQSYMIERRKEAESEEKETNVIKGQIKVRPQNFSDIRKNTGLKISDGMRGESAPEFMSGRKEKVQESEKRPERLRGGIMALQLSAVFLILAAIIINSTNSYPKLKELGQAAVEVFFTMENQEAGGNGDKLKENRETDGDSDKLKENEETDEAVDNLQENEGEGITLRLEDLDAKFEEENQAAKKEETDVEDNTSESEDAEKEDEKPDDVQEMSKEEEETAAVQDLPEDKSGADAAVEETISQEAFARNFAEYYQIEKGDTLCNISIKLYGDASRVKEICEINKISDPDNIKYGQKILLP